MDVMKLLEAFTYVLPLLICIYNLGRITAEHKRMQEDINELKSRDDDLVSRIEDNRASNETAISTIMVQLNNISIQIAKLATKLNVTDL